MPVHDDLYDDDIDTIIDHDEDELILDDEDFELLYKMEQEGAFV
tara:strand:+ start:1122 stop:1253 length:132 start_codon:yes stop_codon:yes gene_type:complete